VELAGGLGSFQRWSIAASLAALLVAHGGCVAMGGWRWFFTDTVRVQAEHRAALNRAVDALEFYPADLDFQPFSDSPCMLLVNSNRRHFLVAGEQEAMWITGRGKVESRWSWPSDFTPHRLHNTRTTNHVGVLDRQGRLLVYDAHAAVIVSDTRCLTAGDKHSVADFSFIDGSHVVLLAGSAGFATINLNDPQPLTWQAAPCGQPVRSVEVTEHAGTFYAAGDRVYRLDEEPTDFHNPGDLWRVISRGREVLVNSTEDWECYNATTNELLCRLHAMNADIEGPAAVSNQCDWGLFRQVDQPDTLVLWRLAEDSPVLKLRGAGDPIIQAELFAGGAIGADASGRVFLWRWWDYVLRD